MTSKLPPEWYDGIPQREQWIYALFASTMTGLRCDSEFIDEQLQIIRKSADSLYPLKKKK